MATIHDIVNKIQNDTEWIRSLIKRDANILLSIFLRHFNETKNPLFAWKIFSVCRNANLPIPEVILEYLDDCADNICQLAEDPPKKTEERTVRLGKALKFHKDKSGRGSYYEEYKNRFKEIRIALDTHEEIKEYQGAKDYAYEGIGAKYNMSKSTVMRIYKKYSKRW